MNAWTKSLLSAGAAAAALVSVAVPAQAKERHDRHRYGTSAGAVLVGAAVIVGLAALLSAGKSDRNYEGDNYEERRHDRRHDQLDDKHEDFHEDLNSYHDEVHEKGVSWRGHRRLHRDLNGQHYYYDNQLEREHRRKDRRDYRW